MAYVGLTQKSTSVADAATAAERAAYSAARSELCAASWALLAIRCVWTAYQTVTPTKPSVASSEIHSVIPQHQPWCQLSRRGSWTALPTPGHFTDCRVACLGGARDEDVQAHADRGLEERRGLRGQRAEADDVVQARGPHHVLADVYRPVVASTPGPGPSSRSRSARPCWSQRDRAGGSTRGGPDVRSGASCGAGGDAWRGGRHVGRQDATHWHVPAWDGLLGSGPLLVPKTDGAVTMLPSVPPWPQNDAMARVGCWPDDGD